MKINQNCIEYLSQRFIYFSIIENQVQIGLLYKQGLNHRSVFDERGKHSYWATLGVMNSSGLPKNWSLLFNIWTIPLLRRQLMNTKHLTWECSFVFYSLNCVVNLLNRVWLSQFCFFAKGNELWPRFVSIRRRITPTWVVATTQFFDMIPSLLSDWPKTSPRVVEVTRCVDN